MSIRIGASRIGPRVGTVRARRGRLPLARLAGILVAAMLCCVPSVAVLAQAPNDPEAANGATSRIEAQIIRDGESSTVSDLPKDASAAASDRAAGHPEHRAKRLSDFNQIPRRRPRRHAQRGGRVGH